jgi:hypothetical protein
MKKSLMQKSYTSQINLVSGEQISLSITARSPVLSFLADEMAAAAKITVKASEGRSSSLRLNEIDTFVRFVGPIHGAWPRKALIDMSGAEY